MDLRIHGVPLDPPVMWKILFHFDSRSRFAVFYVPESGAGLQLGKHILANFAWLANGPLRIEMRAQNEFAELVNLADCMFVGRVILYIDSPLTGDDADELLELGSARNLAVVVRDAKYAQRRDNVRKPLAFVSHDWRDKETIARPLAVSLTQRLCNVWYDEFTLRVGDSLRDRIEDGLRNCKKCIVLLTPHFLGNERWANSIRYLHASSSSANECFCQYGPVLAARMSTPTVQFWRIASVYPGNKASRS